MDQDGIYSLAEMRAANKKAGGKYFHSSHEKADKRDGVITSKNGNVVTKTRADGTSYSYRFIPETGQMRPVKLDEIEPTS